MKRTIPFPLYVLVFAVGMAKLLIMAWSVNRGFDIGDEGLYMLALSNPEQYKVLAHGFVLNKLLPISHYTIPVSRSISIILELAGGLIFSIGLWRWAKSNVNWAVPFMFIWGLALMASFQSILARCVSYNDVSYFLGLSAIGAVLFGTSLSGLSRWFVYTLATFCIGMAFVFKAPVSISLGFLFVVYLTVTNGAAVAGNLLKSLLVLAVGLGLAALALTGIYSGMDWLAVVQKVKITADLLNYKPLDLVGMYLIYDGTPNLVFLTLGVAIFAISKSLFSKFSQSLLVSFIAAMLVAALVGYLAIQRFDGLLVVEERPVYFYLWVIILSIFWLLFELKKNTENQPWVTIVLLLALPLAIIGGTNGFITESLFAFWIPWFGIVAICLARLLQTTDNRSYWIISMVLVSVTGAQFVQSKVLHPFGMPHDVNLLQQHQPVAGNDGLLVDYRTKYYFEQYQQVLKEANIKPGTPILAMNYMPGLVYLAQGYSPGAPFYIYDESFNAYNCHYLQQGVTSGMQPVVLVRNTAPFETMQCVRNVVEGFPNSYRKSITIDDPYYRVYEYENIGDSQLYIYLPL